MSSEFLAELHWEDGFAIPVANEENKLLEDQVRSVEEGGRKQRGPAGGRFLVGSTTPALLFLSFPNPALPLKLRPPSPSSLTLSISVIVKHLKMLLKP